MSISEQIQESLDHILVPGVRRSLTQMNLVKSVEINNEELHIDLWAAALTDQSQHWLKSKAEETMLDITGVEKVSVNFADSKPAEINRITRAIAVMSGKGGVGKSLLAGLLALSLSREGYQVGILDADITGPSIPKMFGLTEHPAGNNGGILPVLSKTGIEIMSMNLLLPDEEEAVIWRGPLMAKAIIQFWEEVLWGNLDYLIIDVPPGTGDIPLTLMQTIPLTGVIDIFTPQDLTEMIVMKAIKMAEKLNVKVLGVIENMSYLTTSTNQRIEVFGRSKGEEMARNSGAPLLGKLPIDPELAKLCDSGKIEQYMSENLSSIKENLLSTLDGEKEQR